MANTEINPKVFLDIEIAGQQTGRMVIELFYHKNPITAENFRALCTGEKGIGQSGRPLHFKGCNFHRVIPDSLCQSGDITDGIGTGGESIYGLRFDDENFTRQHGGPGDVSMANYGPNSNSSQFHITTTMASWIDGKHVVFGRVLDGVDVLRKIEEVGSSSGQPTLPVIISHCGQLYI